VLVLWVGGCQGFWWGVLGQLVALTEMAGRSGRSAGQALVSLRGGRVFGKLPCWLPVERCAAGLP
tara:strand:+ start:554 stop:748 length:195 start_codon:yes stop_codon:yes gene_type:complete